MFGGSTITDMGRNSTRAILRGAGALGVAIVIIGSATGALSVNSAQASIDAKASSVSESTHAQLSDSAMLRVTAASVRTDHAVTEAHNEIVRADALAKSSKGEASAASLKALAAATSNVADELDSASSYRLHSAVLSLRESEKVVSDSAAVWKKAEHERLAKEAAARVAAAEAAAETAVYSASHESASNSGNVSTAPSSSSTPSSSPTQNAPSHSRTAASTPYFAPGVSHSRPSNDPCGPCPGATLVLTTEGYWGCPL